MAGVAHAVGVVKVLAVQLPDLRGVVGRAGGEVGRAGGEIVDAAAVRDDADRAVHQAQGGAVHRLAAVAGHRDLHVGHDVADVAPQAHRRAVGALVQHVAHGRRIVQRVIGPHRQAGLFVRRYDAVHLVSGLGHRLLRRQLRQERERLGPAAVRQPRRYIAVRVGHHAQAGHAQPAAAGGDLLPQQRQRILLRRAGRSPAGGQDAGQHQRRQQQCQSSFHKVPPSRAAPAFTAPPGRPMVCFPF